VVGGGRCGEFSGFQVRDSLLDFPSYGIDGGVELFLPVEEIAVEWFLDRVIMSSPT
jgi:hypothetical protein